jgi:hypothetical protein
MYSLFLERETGRLAKIVGSSQEGCGLTFKRWDRLRRKLSYDSYWEGEGRGERDLPKEEREFFLDELGYVGALLDDGARIVVYPSLLRNKVGGFEGVACSVERAGRTCTVKDEQGGLVAEYVYDADGFLERWRIDGGEFAQEFERVSKTRLYYWEFTKPGDAKKLEGK